MHGVTSIYVICLSKGHAKVPVHDHVWLASGVVLVGPAVVSQLDAAMLITPRWRDEVVPSGP